MTNWENVARICQELYGSYIDWEERFYICPECCDPVYEDDYDRRKDFYPEKGVGPICPICEYNYGADE